MDNNENIVKKLIGKTKEYITVTPSGFTKGHGGSLSVKIVLPCYCQAHCPFCFNNLTFKTQKHDYERFFENLPKSLDMIFNSIKNRPITLDITGNEPTFDPENFSKLMKILKKYKHSVQKIVLTTNGFKLERCLEDMIGVVDIINISVHHYEYEKRKNIFNTKHIPSDEELKKIIEILNENDITCTSVAVLYTEIQNFKEFYNKFIRWAKQLGFKDARMRSNFCSSDKFIDDIINTKMTYEKFDEGGPLTIKVIKYKKLDFDTYILKGVPDLTEYVIGFELVIDDDGLCYIDYNKRFPVDDLKIKYFNNAYIFKC